MVCKATAHGEHKFFNPDPKVSLCRGQPNTVCVTWRLVSLTHLHLVYYLVNNYKSASTNPSVNSIEIPWLTLLFSEDNFNRIISELIIWLLEWLLRPRSNSFCQCRDGLAHRFPLIADMVSSHVSKKKNQASVLVELNYQEPTSFFSWACRSPFQKRDGPQVQQIDIFNLTVYC